MYAPHFHVPDAPGGASGFCYRTAVPVYSLRSFTGPRSLATLARAVIDGLLSSLEPEALYGLWRTERTPAVTRLPATRVALQWVLTRPGMTETPTPVRVPTSGI